MSGSYTLIINCPDRPGIVYNVSGIIFAHGGNILESRQFEDRETGRFFLRIVFESDAEESVMADALGKLGTEFAMDWRLVRTGQPVKVLILVSKFDHCLAYLLYKVRMGEMPLEVVGIASNHPASALTASDIRDIPFHHLPVTRDTRAEQEACIKELVEESGAELVVLARYMQILSDDLATYLSGRCINIHHSFLPSFKGAKPYHQAHAHGVKMIGATAHYVTAELDEGPIIHQAVERVTHEDSADDLVRKGREVENHVLGDAVGWHVEHRVIMNGRKTVVFRN
ncbi:formyltetrahydrofolate deformylase [Croceibacterium mercuriale]|uniref:Formyltetrahydrofolate deformylase n=1 Tax=Croceibacterium mercuriale TaxID=1572751 RepID=A0A0B2BV20_9SPHN|nr:formyltetrahydrofolate deformylase [Croceibacterium mercuriale]KHL25473.1 formyltetrahydrofolate deformylase [Croceibacterium mercuriale]